MISINPAACRCATGGGSRVPRRSRCWRRARASCRPSRPVAASSGPCGCDRASALADAARRWAPAASPRSPRATGAALLRGNSRAGAGLRADVSSVAAGDAHQAARCEGGGRARAAPAAGELRGRVEAQEREGRPVRARNGDRGPARRICHRAGRQERGAAGAARRLGSAADTPPGSRRPSVLAAGTPPRSATMRRPARQRPATGCW